MWNMVTYELKLSDVKDVHWCDSFPLILRLNISAHLKILKDRMSGANWDEALAI